MRTPLMRLLVLTEDDLRQKSLCLRRKKNKNLIRRPWLTARESALEKIKCTWSSTKISVPASKKKKKSNSSTLADSKGKRVRENKMYMVLSTNLYIYTFSCIFPRPAAAFWVGRKSSSNRSSRKVLCLIVQKVVQKLAENDFLCRKNTRERCRGCGKRHYEKMHCGQNTI